MSKQKNWQSFSKTLKGSKYSSPQKSTLYQKYKQGIIDEHELKSPKTLTKYLKDDYDFKAMKTRLLSYFKNFKSFSEENLKYIKDGYHNLKEKLEYVELIKQDLDGEIDYIIEETQEIVNQLKNNKFKSANDTEFVDALEALVIFDEKEIAADLMQKMAEIDDSVYYGLYLMYKHFPKSFGGKLGALKKRLINEILKFRFVDKKLKSDAELYWSIEHNIKYYKKNPAQGAIDLILGYVKFKNSDDYIDEYYDTGGVEDPLVYFTVLGELDIAYDEYKKMAAEGGSRDFLEVIYKHFGDWVEKNKGSEFRIKYLKDISKTRKLDKDEIARLIKFYDSTNEKLRKKVLELEKKLSKSEEKVLDLTYRPPGKGGPGGPGFESAKSRQVGKYGLKG